MVAERAESALDICGAPAQQSRDNFQSRRCAGRATHRAYSINVGVKNLFLFSPSLSSIVAMESTRAV